VGSCVWTGGCGGFCEAGGLFCSQPVQTCFSSLSSRNVSAVTSKGRGRWPHKFKACIRYELSLSFPKSFASPPKSHCSPSLVSRFTNPLSFQRLFLGTGRHFFSCSKSSYPTSEKMEERAPLTNEEGEPGGEKNLIPKPKRVGSVGEPSPRKTGS